MVNNIVLVSTAKPEQSCLQDYATVAVDLDLDATKNGIWQLAIQSVIAVRVTRLQTIVTLEVGHSKEVACALLTT